MRSTQKYRSIRLDTAAKRYSQAKIALTCVQFKLDGEIPGGSLDLRRSENHQFHAPQPGEDDAISLHASVISLPFASWPNDASSASVSATTTTVNASTAG
jgi:hypothetical protein